MNQPNQNAAGTLAVSRFLSAEQFNSFCVEAIRHELAREQVDVDQDSTNFDSRLARVQSVAGNIKTSWGGVDIVKRDDPDVEKYLVIRGGTWLAFEKHELKVETLAVESGHVILLRRNPGESEVSVKHLRAGDSALLNPGDEHCLIAVKNSLVYETSKDFKGMDQDLIFLFEPDPALYVNISPLGGTGVIERSSACEAPPTITRVRPDHHSVIVRFDQESEERIASLQQIFLENGLIEQLPPGPPHFTLACSHRVDVSRLQSEIAAGGLVLDGEFLLQAIAMFPAGDDKVVFFLTGAINDTFPMLHKGVYRAFAASAEDSLVYYQPDRLTPHCTLASPLRISDVPRAIELVQQSRILPRALKFSSLELLEVPSQESTRLV